MIHSFPFVWLELSRKSIPFLTLIFSQLSQSMTTFRGARQTVERMKVCEFNDSIARNVRAQTREKSNQEKQESQTEKRRKGTKRRLQQPTYHTPADEAGTRNHKITQLQQAERSSALDAFNLLSLQASKSSKISAYRAKKSYAIQRRT